MVKVSTASPSPGFHVSHRPANAKRRRSGSVIAKGCFWPGAPFHSKNPVAGTRQRRWRMAARKAGFASTPSERALIILVPTPRSLAQEGTSPQRSVASSRAPSFPMRTTGACWVGAMLKRLRTGSCTGTRNV